MNGLNDLWDISTLHEDRSPTPLPTDISISQVDWHILTLSAVD